MAEPIVSMHVPGMMSGTFERGVWRSVKTGARLEYRPADLSDDNLLGGNFRNLLILDRSVKKIISMGFTPFSSIGRDGNPAVPAEFTVVGNPECPFSNLVLTNMTPKIGASNNIVDVEINYEHVMDGYNQIIRNPPSRRLYVKGRSSIVDKSTNFFRKDGNPLAPQVQLTVAHTYPEKDRDITATPFDPNLPRTVVQTGEINVPFPAQGFTIQGILFTNDVLEDGKNLIAHINEETLLKQPAKYWICSEFAWEMHCGFNTQWFDNRPGYKVSMEFQYNYDTWEPLVVFHDKRFGDPPANMQEARENGPEGVLRMTRNFYNLSAQQPAGYWKVPYLPTCNFTNFFGNPRFEVVG